MAFDVQTQFAWDHYSFSYVIHHYRKYCLNYYWHIINAVPRDSCARETCTCVRIHVFYLCIYVNGDRDAYWRYCELTFSHKLHDKRLHFMDNVFVIKYAIWQFLSRRAIVWLIDFFSQSRFISFLLEKIIRLYFHAFENYFSLIYYIRRWKSVDIVNYVYFKSKHITHTQPVRTVCDSLFWGASGLFTWKMKPNVTQFELDLSIAIKNKTKQSFTQR